MFGAADDPDENHFACRAGASCVGGEQVANVGDLVCNAYAGGEEHDCAVGVEVGALAAVGTFDEGGGEEFTGCGGGGAVPHAVGEACAAADD